jgi:hypothetical protein
MYDDSKTSAARVGGTESANRWSSGHTTAFRRAGYTWLRKVILAGW